MATWLRLGQVQGNITPGFRKPHQVFLLLRFRDAASGRRWLEDLRPEVASAAEVAEFNRAFKLVRRRRPDREAEVIRATWVNVAFSWLGLQRLEASHIGAFPSEFQEGLFGRAPALGDGETRGDRRLGDWGNRRNRGARDLAPGGRHV